MDYFWTVKPKVRMVFKFNTLRWRGITWLVKPDAIVSSKHGWQKKLQTILAYDFFPEIDKLLIDWVKKPLGILVLASLFSGLCGFVVHPHGFVFMGALLLIILIGLIWPWISVLGLKATIEFVTQRAVEGDTVPFRLKVTNRMPWCAWGLGIQVTDGGAKQADGGISHACGWRTTEVTQYWTPEHRGEYPTCQPYLFCGYPFGLWKARKAMAVKQLLLVWPRMFPVGSVPESSGRSTHEGLIFRNKPGNAGDILGVRPFRDGDSLRRIHWPQTARHGQLIVCERQTPGLPAIQILLDTHPESHSGTGSEGSREWAIRIAASLAAGWLEEGALVGSMIQGKPLGFRGGNSQKRVILDALARIHLKDEPRLEALLRIPAVNQAQASVNVLITTDLSLQRQGLPTAKLRDMLVVVLRTSGFAIDELPEAEETSLTQLPVQPWIDVPSASNLPTLFHKTWKA